MAKTRENEERINRLKGIVDNMPELPGSYQFWNGDKVIIYVGKAKNLKRRVSSYLHKEVDRFKTKVLVSKIEDITYTVVKTETDALLLENSLIKKYNPRYNVLLKDGKTYPSICVTNEPYPRIFKTRQIKRLHACCAGDDTPDIPTENLSAASDRRECQTGQIQAMSGIPHTQLQGPMYRKTVVGGIQREHTTGEGDTQGQHKRTVSITISGDAQAGRKHGV